VGVFSPRASPARSSRRRHSRSLCGPGRPKPTPSDDAEPDLDFSDILREDWFALSCRSGTGEAFTAAMPRDLTLEYIAASLLDEAPGGCSGGMMDFLSISAKFKPLPEPGAGERSLDRLPG
jgi:hypothetical protein